MECTAKLPPVRQEDGDYFARLYASVDEATGKGFDRLAVLRESHPAAAGSVDQSRLRRVQPAGIEHKIVQKKVVRVSVELGAQHAARNCSGIEERGLTLAYFTEKLPFVHVKIEGLAA